MYLIPSICPPVVQPSVGSLVSEFVPAAVTEHQRRAASTTAIASSSGGWRSQLVEPARVAAEEAPFPGCRWCLLLASRDRERGREVFWGPFLEGTPLFHEGFTS